MTILNRSSDKLVLELSCREMTIAHNSLNEVCNGFHVPDFHSRIGVQEEEAIQLLDEFVAHNRRERR